MKSHRSDGGNTVTQRLPTISPSFRSLSPLTVCHSSLVRTRLADRGSIWITKVTGR